MTALEGETPQISNSIVFDISNANLALTNANITGITTDYSSPVLSMVKDASLAQRLSLTIENSTFAHNQA